MCKSYAFNEVFNGIYKYILCNLACFQVEKVFMKKKKTYKNKKNIFYISR